MVGGVWGVGGKEAGWAFLVANDAGRATPVKIKPKPRVGSQSSLSKKWVKIKPRVGSQSSLSQKWVLTGTEVLSARRSARVIDRARSVRPIPSSTRAFSSWMGWWVVGGGWGSYEGGHTVSERERA